MNIVWKRPDGGVSVTHITPETAQFMARGNSLRPLVAQRVEIQALLDRATEQLAELHAHVVPEEAVDPVLAANIEEVSLIRDRSLANLALIAGYDFIYDNVGLSLADHAGLLQSRAQADWDAALALDPAAPKPEILDWIVVAEGIDMPASREWRGAWTWTTDEPVIDVCPVKAVEVTKERLRRERAPLMAELDVAYMRASEAGDTAAVVAEKERLRNITALADQVPAGDLAALSALSCA